MPIKGAESDHVLIPVPALALALALALMLSYLANNSRTFAPMAAAAWD